MKAAAIIETGIFFFASQVLETITQNSARQSALIRSRGSAAMKVIVFQWPRGSIAWRRWPLGPQPRSGAMLVLIQVSSTKTNRAASILFWCAFQRCRLWATSGLFRSADCFFEAQALGVNENPHRARICLDATCSQLRRQLRIVNGPDRIRCRNQSALAPDRIRFLWPFILSALAYQSLDAASSTWKCMTD
jgi:hypothetical protein